MNAKGRIALAVGLVLLLTFALWRIGGAPDALDEERPAAPAAAERTEVRERPDLPDAGRPPAESEASAEESAVAAETGSGAAPTEEAPAATGPPAAPPGAVAGRIVLDGGGDLSAVRLKIERLPRGRDRIEHVQEIEPGTDGTFYGEGVPPGRYRLTALHSTLAARALTFDVVSGAEAGPLEVVFRRGGALLVTVLDSAEQPLLDEEIEVSGPDYRTVVTGAGGAVEVPRLPVGSYRLHWKKIDRQVAVLEGETTEYTFREAATFSGTVVGPDGKAPGSCIVKLHPVKWGPEGYRDFTDHGLSGGSFTIRGIQPGEYTVSVQVLRPDHYVATCGKISFEPGEAATRDIRVQPTAITGRITRADTGRPLKHNEVQVTAHRVRLEDGKVVEHDQRDRAMAFTDRSGRYEFLGLSPGHWEVCIFPHARELREGYRVVEVTEGGRVDRCDFELPPKRLGTLRVTVLDEEGKPMAGRFDYSRVFEKDGQTWWATLRAKSRDGATVTFEFDEGPRRVAIHRRGYRPEPKEVVADIEAGRTVERTCRLIPQGAVLVTVLDAAGEPVEKAIVSVVPRDGEPRTLGARALRNGVFEVWVDPGEARLSARSGESTSDVVTVEAKVGESVSTTVRLTN